MSLQTFYKDIEEITTHSALIVEVELTGNSRKFYYGNTDWNVVEVEITKVHKGFEGLKSAKIQILEVASLNPAGNRAQNKHLLFLKRYSGPMFEDEDAAYIVTGVYQGNLRIGKNDILTYDPAKYNGYVSFQSDLDGQPLSVAEQKIRVAVSQTVTTPIVAGSSE
ncbi:hypothetical protein [Cohnella yongneupensis]|uniref:Uncharacterized protein n=1 Tax=Cohnella yongneupensis TaxID=425006 RepID=A0ABW0QWD5_9BACL